MSSSAVVRRRGGANPLLLFLLKIFKGLGSSLLPSCPRALAAAEPPRRPPPPSGWDPHGYSPNMTIGLSKLSGQKRYKLSKINLIHPSTRAPVPGALDSFRDVIQLIPGGSYTKAELSQVLAHLSSTSLFDKIDFDVRTNPDGTVDLNVPHKESVFPHKPVFRCTSVGMLPPDDHPILPDKHSDLTGNDYARIFNKLYKRQQLRNERARDCLLPEDLQEEFKLALRQSTSLRPSLVMRIVAKIHKWYHENGYQLARVVSIPGLDANPGREVVVEIDEGEIKKIAVSFKDSLGNTCQGNTDIRIINKALPNEVAIGKPFHRRGFDEAYSNLNSLGLFSAVDMFSKQDETSGAQSLEIELRENPQTWSDVQTTWNVAPGHWGLPEPEWFKPGATIQFGHRNTKGLNRKLEGQINLANLFDPGDDVDFHLDYTHPYIDGIEDPRNRNFRASCFNTRKVSTVFMGGSTVDAPFISVERRGIKATITQDYTRQSRFTYGLVVEDVLTRDEEGDIAPRGHRLTMDDNLRRDGPPTTLSGTGNDRLAFLQANLTRDTTRFVNGATVGARDVFQVDQGTFIGSKLAFFNRFKLSATRYIPLRKVEEGKGNPAPPTLVLHGLYANCIGDLPNHEAFLIGGPNSVRGYTFGEIAASRSKLEVAAEVRIPVKKSFVYAFVEHGNDLGSSAAVVGNPTKSYLRKGHGSSYGVGVKYGEVRAEYTVDHNTNRGAFFIHCGERF